MAVLYEWDGSTLPVLGGDASSVSVDAAIGDPAPSWRFDAGVAAYHSFPTTLPAIKSLRFHHRTPELDSASLAFVRFANISITHYSESRLWIFFTSGSGGEFITVARGVWLTIEINLTSSTTGRVRIWDADDVLIYDRSGTYAARTGGYLGTGSASPGTGKPYHLDQIIVTDTAEDITPVEPEPEPMRGLKAHDGAAWVEHPAKAHDGTAWVAGKIRRYGDDGWPLSEMDQIDAATTVVHIQDALNSASTEYAVTTTISNGTANTIGTYTSPTTIDDGYIKTAAKALIEALRRYPLDIFKNASGGSDGWKLWLGRTLVISGDREVAGVYYGKGVAMNTDSTDKQLEMLADRYQSVVFVTHHEIAHGLWEQKTGAALDTFKAEMAAAQPPGHVWGTQDDPFTGEHPVGFPRWYGRTNANEDQADIVGWVLTDHLWERDGSTWFADDPYLAAKAAAARKWLGSLGFAGL